MTRIQNFAVYISDTPVTLKQSQGHKTYTNPDPKVISMQSSKALTLMVSYKKPMSNKEICQLSPLSMCKKKKKKKSSIFMIYLM